MSERATGFDVNLDEYFARIGFVGPRTATLQTLQVVHLAHVQSIAFENLNPLLGLPVPIDLPSIEDKLVRSGRGGYCFEHNALFAAALGELGFDVTRLAARVLWNAPEDIVRPRGHMLLKVTLDGQPYIADVGFGGLSLTGPLKFVVGEEQATPHETFRVVTISDELAGRASPGHDYAIQAFVAGAWKTLYRFDLQPQHPLDYELPNYFLSTHPSSHFRSMLMAALPIPGGRLALSNNQLTLHRLGAPSERRELASVAQVKQVLQDELGIRLPTAAGLDEALGRACGLPTSTG